MAFSITDHDVHLDWFQRLGIRGTILYWFSSSFFLSCSHCWWGSEGFSPCLILCGYPQGSPNSPLSLTSRWNHCWSHSMTQSEVPSICWVLYLQTNQVVLGKFYFDVWRLWGKNRLILNPNKTEDFKVSWTEWFPIFNSGWEELYFPKLKQWGVFLNSQLLFWELGSNGGQEGLFTTLCCVPIMPLPGSSDTVHDHSCLVISWAD